MALTVGAIELFLVAAQTLLLIMLGLFLAIGLEPAVSWLINHRFPRWAAVLSVFGGMLLLLAGFIASAIPALVDQGGKLVQNAPGVSAAGQRLQFHCSVSSTSASTSRTTSNSS